MMIICLEDFKRAKLNHMKSATVFQIKRVLLRKLRNRSRSLNIVTREGTNAIYSIIFLSGGNLVSPTRQFVLTCSRGHNEITFGARRKPQHSQQAFEKPTEIESTSVLDIQFFINITSHQMMSKSKERYILPRKIINHFTSFCRSLIELKYIKTRQALPM